MTNAPFQIYFSEKQLGIGKSKLFFAKVNLLLSFPNDFSQNTIVKSDFLIYFCQFPIVFLKTQLSFAKHHCDLPPIFRQVLRDFSQFGQTRPVLHSSTHCGAEPRCNLDARSQS